MSTAQTLALGAVAGFTIFIGLPLGRFRSADIRLQAGLSALACGVLLFLLWDVLVHGVAPVEEALEGAVEGEGSWGQFLGYAILDNAQRGDDVTENQIFARLDFALF